MKYDGIKTVLKHKSKHTSLRKLSWHADELSTEVEVRKCVAWNPDLGLHGGWDDLSCTTVITEQAETVCECGEFSTYAIMAEMIEKPSVPDEEKWLSIIKYLGMGISIPCLLFFLFVIIFSQ